MCYNITVVVPVLNEKNYINGFLDSLFRQDYPKKTTEVLFADGGSMDGTVEMIRARMERQPGLHLHYRILNNKGRTAPCAMNLGIKESSGEIIVRMDAHQEYPSNYISKCVYYLTTTDADNVGCPFVLRGRGYVGRCIEKVLTSAFGVGGSGFRKGNAYYAENLKTEYVDTVPLGTFRKETASRLDGFDERYPRAEDNDFNYRLRKAGGKVLLFKDIHTVRFCRSSVQELVRMGFGNGESVGEVFWKAPGTISFRHMIPFLFLLSLVVLAAGAANNGFFASFLIAEIILYGIACITAAICSRVRMEMLPAVMLLFPALHFSYGIGTAAGLAKGLKSKVIKHERFTKTSAD